MFAKRLLLRQELTTCTDLRVGCVGQWTAGDSQHSWCSRCSPVDETCNTAGAEPANWIEDHNFDGHLRHVLAGGRTRTCWQPLQGCWQLQACR